MVVRRCQRNDPRRGVPGADLVLAAKSQVLPTSLPVWLRGLPRHLVELVLRNALARRRYRFHFKFALGVRFFGVNASLK